MTTDFMFTLCNLWAEKLSLQFDFNNSEAKAVVLEVLTVLSGIIVQFSVGYEGKVAPHRFSSFPFCHSTNNFIACCISKCNRVCDVVADFQLVQ